VTDSRASRIPLGPRLSVALAVLVLVIAALVACSPSAPRMPQASGPAAPAYYLALGDSLSRGVQPDAAGASVETAQGYPNLVFARLSPGDPALRLVQLGCPGETTQTMTRGGICRYPGGSQLAAAVAFLRAHPGHVRLVTLDIGADDLEVCGSQLEVALAASCAGQIPGTIARASAILASLRAAAGPDVRIVGMNYYLPALAQWRTGRLGRVVALASERIAAVLNRELDQVYTKAGDGVADVFGAFSTADFGDPVAVTGIGSLPRNVARICQWTWECAPAPRGPNQHANPAGYQVIADAVLTAVGHGS
jgi:lysophospholipase L1-like esterase